MEMVSSVSWLETRLGAWASSFLMFPLHPAVTGGPSSPRAHELACGLFGGGELPFSKEMGL